MSDGIDFTEDEIGVETERLRLFAEGSLEPGMIYEIRPVPHAATGSIWATPDRFAEAVPHLLAWNRAGVNPYFSVNPRRGVGERTGEGSLPGSLLVADFDDGRSLAAVREAIAAAGLPLPTAIVETSPEHWHCYWKLEARLPDLATFKRHQRGLVEKLGSCPAVCSFQQVMRLPGPFCNVKPDRPAKPRVRIVDCDPNRIYAAAAFPLADAEPVYEAVPLEQLATKIEAGSMADATRQLVEQATVMPGKGRRQSIFEAARDMHARAWSVDDATAVLMAVAGKVGLEPDDREDIPRQVRNAFATPATPGFAKQETARIVCTGSAATTPASDDDYLAELESIPLPLPPALPPRPELALAHGVIGDFMRRVEHETEAHAVALAGALLVAIGNSIGRGPHAIVGRTYHYSNLFMAVVGNTGAGRKGTGGDIVADCLRPADEEWATWCHSPNLVSGEGVVEALRDPIVKLVPKKGGGPDDFEETVIDRGVKDKRLLITCTELASAFKAANRENSILSQTLREAWDGKTLRTMAKNCARVATDPHLSIVGHVTRQELVKVARESDIFGGTYNRFVFLLSDRARLLPHGGDLDDLGTVPARIADVIAFARGIGRVKRSPAANRLWESVYHELTTPVGSDLLAAVLSRGEAQTLRLSLLMALVAKRETIEADDLAAALDLWRYAVASARVVFGQVHDPLFEKIVAAVNERPGITRTGLHQRLGWKLGSPELVAALARVQAAGMIHHRRIETRGRPSEQWHPGMATPGGKEEKQEKGNKPPPPAAPDPFPTFSSFPSEAPEAAAETLSPFSSFPSDAPAGPAAPPPAWNPDNLAPGSYSL
jgi:hypothetical protein